MARHCTQGPRVCPARRHCRLSRTCLLNAHQAAEKAVKAIHYGRGASAVLGHGIRQLIERLDIPSLGALLSAARQLDQYHIPARYPNGLDDGTPDEAFSEDESSRALGLARTIVAAAADIIDEPTRDR